MKMPLLDLMRRQADLTVARSSAWRTLRAYSIAGLLLVAAWLGLVSLIAITLNLLHLA
jgi:hypothetical protein